MVIIFLGGDGELVMKNDGRDDGDIWHRKKENIIKLIIFFKDNLKNKLGKLESRDCWDNLRRQNITTL